MLGKHKMMPHISSLSGRQQEPRGKPLILNEALHRGESRISGKGVHIYKGVGVLSHLS